MAAYHTTGRILVIGCVVTQTEAGVDEAAGEFQPTPRVRGEAQIAPIRLESRISRQ